MLKEQNKIIRKRQRSTVRERNIESEEYKTSHTIYT